mgnify:CR=1 FL=1
MADFVYSDHYLEAIAGRDPMPVHERYFEMMRYLANVAPEDKLPGRQHIDPLDFSQFMPLINLMDVEHVDGDVRFRFRLVGTEQIRRGGREITGMLVEDALVPELVPRVQANMRRVLKIRGPVFDSFPLPQPHREFVPSQRMYFPLASDGEAIDMLLTLNGYDPDAALSPKSG